MSGSQHSNPDYRAAAIALWGPAGAFIHDAYAAWHPLLPELPESLPIVIGLSAYGRCLGLTRIDDPHLNGPRITIATQYMNHANDVRDVVLHEMLHVWLHLTNRDTKHAGHDWYVAVNRLSPAVLGHELNARRGAARKSVRIKRDDGTSTVRKIAVPSAIQHADIARWPHAFRPDDYDHGEPIPCPTY